MMITRRLPALRTGGCMVNDLTTYLPTLGDMLARLNIRSPAADGAGGTEPPRNGLLPGLAADADGDRVETALRQVVSRLCELATDDAFLGPAALAGRGTPAAMEVRTTRAHYRVCASRVGHH